MVLSGATVIVMPVPGSANSAKPTPAITGPMTSGRRGPKRSTSCSALAENRNMMTMKGIGVQVRLDGRQRDVDDGAVDEGHARAEDGGQQDAALGGVGTGRGDVVAAADDGLIAGGFSDLGHGPLQAQTWPGDGSTDTPCSIAAAACAAMARPNASRSCRRPQ